ncbi:LssY C-terminal domain-containing protein [Paenarthrobacter sp. Z7-10]|uniref:LssY C-terminal domain-containing protein n=1 Tax=Paenarthrobacter sp. Z7-10 TaxID=2787635 RepID=UPI0022A9097B|nr:LssY C-terminal domain-containing protein [Paenarthrobacter sp. Z7-10]MCZ2404704.1 LssY C-terminal domain-containing protein [Paenarthrobacter sp. Z7-10]
MEPINFIYLGSQVQIENLFKQAGWYKADPSTLSNTLQAILVAVRNDQYLTAPVTPSYLDARPETVAFEKPTDANTLVQRHHTRIWRTNFTIGGQPVWVATASFDRGIGIGTKSGLPTHHIDPNVDTERAYILQSLKVSNPRLVHVTDAQLGHNATGDGFFTDGQAAVLDLKRLNQ